MPPILSELYFIIPFLIVQLFTVSLGGLYYVNKLVKIHYCDGCKEAIEILEAKHK